MSDVALYFPYVNFPDDTWVKAAALHWSQLGRIHPVGYSNLRDSNTVKRLRQELNFVVEVRPGLGGQALVDDEVLERVNSGYFNWSQRRLDTRDVVEALFYDFLDRYKDDLIPRYGAAALGVESLNTREVYDETPPLDPRLQRVHPSKMSSPLARRLADAGLLISRSYQWRHASDGEARHMSDLAMHPRLAGVYLAVFADAVAQENDMTPVTDQAPLCAVASGWTVEAMAQILLDDDETTVDEADCSHVFAVLALQTVLPRDLGDVPVGRIIEARRRLLPEMMRYREFLDSLTPDFVQINAVRDPEVRAAKLRNHVESRIAQPIETMERELGRLGLQPVRAVLSLQTLAPPTALGVLANTVDLPSAVTSAGVVAGCLVGAASSALNTRRQVLAGHPTGYLLDLRRELAPSDAVAQIRSAIRRATSRRRRR